MILHVYVLYVFVQYTYWLFCFFGGMCRYTLHDDQVWELQYHGLVRCIFVRCIYTNVSFSFIQLLYWFAISGALAKCVVGNQSLRLEDVMDGFSTIDYRAIPQCLKQVMRSPPNKMPGNQFFHLFRDFEAESGIFLCIVKKVMVMPFLCRKLGNANAMMTCHSVVIYMRCSTLAANDLSEHF